MIDAGKTISKLMESVSPNQSQLATSQLTATKKSEQKVTPLEGVEDSIEELLQGDMNADKEAKDDRSAHSHNQPGQKEKQNTSKMPN